MSHTPPPSQHNTPLRPTSPRPSTSSSPTHARAVLGPSSLARMDVDAASDGAGAGGGDADEAEDTDAKVIEEVGQMEECKAADKAGESPAEGASTATLGKAMEARGKGKAKKAVELPDADVVARWNTDFGDVFKAPASA
ncbi:hypothetical protein Q5752_003506 [Cryptotrichosporon argae]